MFLLIFLLIFFIGIFTAYRLLWPEMYVKLNRPDFNFLWKKPHLRADITHEEDVDDLTENELPRPIVDMPHEDGSTIVVHEKIEKLGTLLFEKNKLKNKIIFKDFE